MQQMADRLEAVERALRAPVPAEAAAAAGAKKGAEASDNVSIRVRVETPQIWWIAGVALIVAVFAGLYWVFRTYGRR